MRRLLDTPKNIRLVWRLLWDRRVPLFLKMLIPMSLGYLAMPFDLIKDFFPVVGRVDDLLILSIAFIIFVRLAPLQIVQEHREAIWGTRIPESEKVTDAEYQVLNEDDPEDREGEGATPEEHRSESSETTDRNESYRRIEYGPKT
ncbi:MAG: DUF1232 domain-containing protein [Dehalococcoidia bacterium]